MSPKKQLELTEENNIDKTKTETKEVKLELEGEKKYQPIIKIPKWLRYMLMFLPAMVITAIIILTDQFWHEYPETINPTAILAIGGLAIFGLVVIGDMVYRNIFVYKMLRTETKRSRVYKQILKEKKAEKAAQERYEYEEEEEEEYEYDEEESELEEEEEEEEKYIEEEEYKYDVETVDDDREHFRMKSYILRGGILSIALVNAIILLLFAVIFQLTLYGGFNTTV
ncbi:MAG: hypothetical protein JXA54_11365 [Candidatus Heimdallarchaeota archaeon]|nr:hypothetical protein [Candidatus Heimdallarchaeota archaeon]